MKLSRRFIVSIVIGVIVIGLLVFLAFKHQDEFESQPVKRVIGTILSKDNDFITVEGEDDKLYIFDEDEIKEEVGTVVDVEYKTSSDKKTSSKPNSSSQSTNTNKGSSSNNKESSNTETVDNNKVVDYDVVEETKIPTSWLDNGLFKDYYVKAYEKLQTLSEDEKIGQTLLARYPKSNQVSDMNKYHLGGYIFYENDFKDKTKKAVINMISSVQKSSSIPLLTAIDEEGGKVSRLSSNTNLTSTPFKSPQDLYNEGGFDAIVSDVKNKSSVLKGLGLNLNLAPVVDVSTNESDYIYGRTLGLGTSETSTYAKNVIKASKGTGVSYTLKHFPGYGNNADTHLAGSVDNKSLDKIMSEDIPPFKAGIDAGAEAVMISHNIVNSIDSSNEASISKKVHNILRNDLSFTGIIITDDISMGALKNVSNVATKAIQAGNDILITTDYATSFNEIKSSIKNGNISKDDLDRIVFRILSWKYYKGLL